MNLRKEERTGTDCSVPVLYLPFKFFSLQR